MLYTEVTAVRRHKTRNRPVFKCRVTGAQDFSVQLALSDALLKRSLVRARMILILPTAWYPQPPSPPSPEYGWWVRVLRPDDESDGILC